MSEKINLQHYLEYIFLNIAVFIIRLFPLKFIVSASRLIASFIYYFIPIRKKYVLEALALSFPEKSKKEIKLIAKNSYKNFLRTAIEIIFFPTMSDDEIKKLLVIDKEELAEESYAQGRGTVLMSAHFGNWELTALAFSKKYPMSVIVANQSNKLIDAMINKIRTKQGFKTISRDGMPFKEVLKALKKNEVVAVLADQDAGKNGVFVPFFGRLTSMPRGAALFALRAKCPIIIALGVRQNSGVMKVEFTQVDMPNTGDLEKDVEIINSFYSKKLEEAVCKNPEQWFWFHYKWKTRPKQEIGN
jgi:KDO2-lipid IV(A) lauroyltransferase